VKIVTIVGARPQFIKSSVVSRAIKESGNVKEVIVHTGQHFDDNMSGVFFSQMSIPKPNYNLGVNGLSHGAMTGQMLEKIETVLVKECPDWVLVYGDTNSTIAGALAAKKIGIKVAHVEAGLRSNNMRMPEEINRILTDRISDILFCPTDTAVINLRNEGSVGTHVIKSGDVMLDAAMHYSQKSIKPKINLPENFILATLHRAENTDDLNNLKSIIKALETISSNHAVVLPIHPRTKSKLEKINYNFLKSKILFINPVSYFEMIFLLKNCKLVMTDSGGLQKESYFFNKNCIVLREQTEWIELIDNGCNILAGANYETIIREFDQFLGKKFKFDNGLYGDGRAGQIILKSIVNFNKVKE
jgi:UDP-GlcNAc3NAcA epimerase